MTIRVVDGVRRGNAADAGAICTTKHSPEGVPASTYRRMITQLGAPGPLKGRNPDTGEVEYDLDAVKAFNDSRGGPGAWHRDITHRTPMRHDVLAAVAAGRISVIIDEQMKVAVFRDGKPFEGRANTRVFTDLRRGEMIEVPKVGGEVKPTKAGVELLAKWVAEAKEAPAKAG